MGVIYGLIHQFDLNTTMAVMAGMFLLTFCFFYFLVLKDLVPRLIERNRRTEGREKIIFEQEKQLAQSIEDLSEKLASVRADAAALFMSGKQKAIDAQKKIIADARIQATETVARAQEEAALTLQTELKKVSEEVPQIARKIIESVLSPSKRSGGEAALGRGI
jgi:F0F1-type ATP synthase membrane subunit b/b'